MPNDVGDVISKIEGQLDFGQIIGTPLNAVIDAATSSASSYVKFIKNTLNKDGTPITVPFVKSIKNEKGEQEYMKIDIPLLSIVNHPAINIDKFSDTFVLKMSDSFEHKDETKAEGSATVTAGFFGVKASVTAKASYGSTNTRKTDTSAQHTVVVEGSQIGAPEGMMKVIDFLTADLANSSVAQKDVTPPATPGK